jgi:hypothetical protein
MTQKNNTPVETSEAVLLLSPQQHIEKAVAEIKATSDVEKSIAKFKEQYLALQFISLDDRPVYFAIVEAEKNVKNKRLAVEHKRKELNEYPLAYQRAVNAEAKRITEELTPIEEHVKTERKKFEDAEAAEKARVEMEKRTKLIEAGFKFDGRMYTCGVHLIAASAIADMEDAKIEYFVKEATAIVAQEKAAEKKRQDELARIAADQKKLDEEKAALAKAKADFAKEQEAAKPKPTIPNTIVPPLQENPFAVNDPFRNEKPTEIQSNNGDLFAESGNDMAWDASFLKVEPSPEYIDGFEHCRVAVLDLFKSEVKRTRSEFVAEITNLKA